jgi:hypothetical protein
MIDKEYYSLYWQTKTDGEGCGGLGEKPDLMTLTEPS